MESAKISAREAIFGDKNRDPKLALHALYGFRSFLYVSWLAMYL
jgi:hypothetical protein